jgi:hypothetical protein
MSSHLCDISLVKSQPEIFISPDLATPPFSKEVLSEIELIWSAELIKNPKLFNGQSFCIFRRTKERLEGNFIEYKYVLARMRRPDLFEKTPFRPLSVTGISFDGRDLLLGKRADWVMQYPGFYEFSPAGGVDPSCCVGGMIDLRRQTLVELQEETGIPANEVVNFTPFAIIEDDSEGVIEIISTIQLSESARKFMNIQHSEYVNFQWIPIREIDAFIRTNQKIIVPIALGIAKYLRLKV